MGPMPRFGPGVHFSWGSISHGTPEVTAIDASETSGLDSNPVVYLIEVFA